MLRETPERPGIDARWKAFAALEVVLAAAAVFVDVLVPTVVILAMAALSLRARREKVATFGLARPRHPRRMAFEVAGLVAAWSVLQLGVFMPVLEHLTGRQQDLSQFDDLEHNVLALVAFLVLSWTLAAFGEELAYRGYLQTRIKDVFGSGRAGVVVAVAVSSVLFGFAHTEQGTIGVVVTMLDAVFFSVVRLRYRGNLWASILAHGINNSYGLLAVFLVGPIHGFW